MGLETGTSAPPALAWDGHQLSILDQRLLPHEERIVALTDAAGTAEAIACLAIRGAPNIGVAAAYGLAMELRREPSLGRLEAGADTLRAARPTAVNLFHAIERVRAAALGAGPARMAAAARAEAEALHAEEEQASGALADHGAELLCGVRRVMTHCNAGALAACGRGSALAVVAELADRGELHVLACEARPLLQGARLTVYELRRLGIPHELIVDAAAPGLIRRGAVDAVVTGADRIAANGDTANKVGTYGLALAARAARIPFVIVAPVSTVDLTTASGEEIEIEERHADEVRHAAGELLTVAETPCRNPAFDVTPAELITAIVTERGVVRAPDAAELRALLA